MLSASCQVSEIHTAPHSSTHCPPPITDHFQWLVHKHIQDVFCSLPIGYSGPNTSPMTTCSATGRPCWRTSPSRPPSASMTASQTAKTRTAVKQLDGGMEGEPGKTGRIHVCTTEDLDSKNIYSSILYVLFRMYIFCSISVHKKHIYVDIFFICLYLLKTTDWNEKC